MSYIVVENVTKQYTATGPKVLNNINMTVEKGELITLLGSSGCGKTTLLRCIAGLSDISSGKIFINGKDCTNVPTRDRNIGMVFQQYSLFPNMTAYQNIEFGLKMLKQDANTIKRKTEEMLEIVELTAKANSYPAQMSGGQQQRVALARAIVTEPSVLFLDEPLSAIDAKIRKSLQQEIRRIQQKFGITTIFVTHDQNEAMLMSDKIFLMDRGMIAQSGTPDEVYTKPSCHFTASFIGSNNVMETQVFNNITGAKKVGKYVVVRPETVRVYKEEKQVDGCLVFPATIKDLIIDGSTIQLETQVKEEKFTVRILYNTEIQYKQGDQVFLALHEKDCIELEQ